MKFRLLFGTTFLWLVSTSNGQSSSSSCNTYQDRDSCLHSVDDSTNEPCSWCVSGAIPSECMSREQATILPSGVFDCSTPGMVSSGTKTYKLRLNSNDGVDLSNSDICDATSKSISGYMDIKGSKYDQSGENKHLFFWMFEKRGGNGTSSDTHIPFIVWLTGGPGCSSTLALLTENGPCSVAKDGKSTQHNPYSWTESAHVLWLDQPSGVGFSYGEETDTGEEMVSEDAYYFLQAFFQTYPKYQKSPLYIVGESYAGHYVPAIAHRVWLGNKAAKPHTIPLNLTGIAIGNGLTDPEHQYPSYPEMAVNNSHGIKILPDSAVEAMEKVVPTCVSLIHQCNSGDTMINTFACQSAFLVCNAGLTSPYQATGLNPYDITLPCAKPPLCYDFSNVKHFLNLESTKKALNVDAKHSHSWDACNFGINMRFHTDWMKNFGPYVADLLNDGLPALIYAGDLDYICNYLGNRAWTLELEWNGKNDFNKALEHDWETKGLARSAMGLTFLQVYNAGHMVPSDQPANSLDMITHFINGGSF